MIDPLPWRLLRWVYGAFYLVSGVHFLLVLVGVAPPPPLKLSPASAAFQQALTATGFITPILFATYAIAGACLQVLRTAPLGIVLLAPLIVVIFLTNVLLDTAYVWGAGHLLVCLALAWHFRSAYTGLWQYPQTKAA